MSNGIIFKNDSGRAIISDVSSSLYFLGKATVSATVVGGSLSSAKVVCGTTYTYLLAANSSTQPIAFVSCPTGRCAMLRIYRAGTSYYADILAKGNVSIPEVYVFGVKPAYSGPEKYGMRVIKSNGDVAYDSRNGRILSLKTIQQATFLANSAALPLVRAAYVDYYNYPDYRSYSATYGLDVSSYNPIQVPTVTKPAVAINTIAICNRTTRWTRVQENFEYYFGWYSIFYQVLYYVDSVVYRGGWTVNSTNQISLCWVPHVASQSYSAVTQVPQDSWIPPSGYGSTGGTLPYANASINLTGGTISLINGADYD